MKKLFKIFLLATITTFALSSCEEEDMVCDTEEDKAEDVIDNSVAFYEGEIKATWKVLFEGAKAIETGEIESLTRISGSEYQVTANVSLEGRDYNIVGKFKLYSDEITISLNGGEEKTTSLRIDECNACTGNAFVFFSTGEKINSLNSVVITIHFESDF